MRHPFDGIVTPTSTRRGWLGVALTTLGGLFFASRATAAAPPSKTSDDVDPEPKKRPKAITEAKNEAAVTQALRENGAVTKALREAMTRAINEGGGPRITTLALNEEGN